MPKTPPSGGGGGRRSEKPAAPPARGRSRPSASDPLKDPVFKTAAALVRELGAAEFVRLYGDTLHSKILESDTFAENTPGNGDMMFMALMMPITNGIIHLSADRQTIEGRLRWVRRRWKRHPDPHSVLSLLMLAYVARTGWDANSEGPRRKQWNRVLERVRHLSRGISDEDEAAPASPPA